MRTLLAAALVLASCSDKAAECAAASAEYERASKAAAFDEQSPEFDRFLAMADDVAGGRAAGCRAVRALAADVRALRAAARPSGEVYIQQGGVAGPSKVPPRERSRAQRPAPPPSTGACRQPQLWRTPTRVSYLRADVAAPAGGFLSTQTNDLERVERDLVCESAPAVECAQRTIEGETLTTSAALERAAACCCRERS